MTPSQNGQIIQPYLFFGGKCEEAVDFYCKALDGKVEMSVRFKDSPEPHDPGMLAPGFEDKIMHCSFRIGQTTVMASDGCGPHTESFNGFSLSLTVPSEEEATRYFNALKEGGEVQMPLSKTFWCSLFGMVKDKFGVGWMVSVIPSGKFPPRT